MNPHIQTPDRDHKRPSRDYLLIPRNPLQDRQIRRLRLLIAVLSLLLLVCFWVMDRRHAVDIHAGAKACISGWRTCRAYAGMRNPIAAVEDFGTPCGEGYQICLQKVEEAAQ